VATFVSADSLGARSPNQIGDYLTEIGALDEAKHFTQVGAGGQHFLSAKRPYTHTGMVVGFIAPNQAANAGIQALSAVTADAALPGQRIKITLDKFFVSQYPGFGEHSILCEFTGKNQVAGEAEELTFAVRFKSKDNAGPSISGAPIFMGVTVGKDGISFKGRTVNVSNSTDEMVLATFDSPAFKNGLALLHTAQPALKPLTSLATSVVASTLQRKKNAQIHSFDLGLDFGSNSTSARLRLGSYVVVQSDDAGDWDWSQYSWSGDGMTLKPNDLSKSIDFNYMVFGVTTFSDASAVAEKSKARKP